MVVQRAPGRLLVRLGALAVDVDEDGFLACAECNDGAAPIYPGADEVCDALDSDCDGNVDSTELDYDSDGWIDCSDFVPNGAVGFVQERFADRLRTFVPRMVTAWSGYAVMWTSGEVLSVR